jgi:hypothetical protein
LRILLAATKVEKQILVSLCERESQEVVPSKAKLALKRMPCFSTQKFILAMALGSRESEEINPKPYTLFGLCLKDTALVSIVIVTVPFVCVRCQGPFVSRHTKKIRFSFVRRQENLGSVGEPGTGIAMEFSDPTNPSAR